MKTFSQKSSEVSRDWWIVDASSMPLGKLAVVIADKIIGKSKVSFTPHTDNGDHVVVINAAKIQASGNKLTDKHYYSHSGFPGGLKDLTLKELIEKDPTFVVKHAVAGMIPKNKLHAPRMARLRVFPGAEHAHTAQTPKEIK
ncbi:50S ribosomal protein L13 [Candidatus Saccharibacteria bacterium]|nr:50S ribosomal protein L13 [Candidatus Saccharibacteria bacterium]